MDKMTDLSCAGLKEYTYTKHRCNFGKWLCNKGLNISKSQYKEVWEGTNTNAKDLFDLAAKAAGKAITAGTAPKGFTIGKAGCILKEIGFCELAKQGVKWLPDPESFDEEHRAWCEKGREEAKRDWSYGRSAKLINVFLKAVMLCKHETLPDGKEKAKWYAVHPPIDRRVLTGMNDPKNPKRGEVRFGYRYKCIWINLPGKNGEPVRIPSGIPNWTLFNKGDYQSVIDLIRKNLSECGETDPLPLWKNERFFKP